MKRFLSAVLLLAMLAQIVPVSADAQVAEENSESDGQTAAEWHALRRVRIRPVSDWFRFALYHTIT